MNNVHSLQNIRTGGSPGACANCISHPACLSAGLAPPDQERLAALIVQPQRVPRGNYLYRAGTELRMLFAIRSGSLKSCVLDIDGREQVIGFHLPPELLGMDAIGTGVHKCDVIALEDSEICKIPFSGLQQLSREIPALGHNLNRMISHEIGRGYGVMFLLGSMRADERLASFLLNLSRRFLALGRSPFQFILRMSRGEIGSYLGLKLETVSRMFSLFQREGMIAVECCNNIRLTDPEKLKVIAHGATARLRGLPVHEDCKVVAHKSPARMPARATAPPCQLPATHI